MLSYAELSRIVPLCEQTLAGLRVQKLRVLPHYGIALEFYGRPRGADAAIKRWLLLSADPKQGRLHTLQSPPEASGGQHPFLDQLKKHLKRASLARIALLQDERIVELHFESKAGYRLLVLELLGSVGNVFLLDADRHILGALRSIPPSRGVKQGELWSRPASSALPDAAKRDRFSHLQDDALLNMVEDEYQNREEAQDATALRKRIKHAIEREHEAIGRTMTRIEEELDSQSRYQEYRRWGELMKAYLEELEAVGGHVHVIDYDDEGDPVEVKIPVDPVRSMKENMEHYFFQFRKGAKGSQKLGTHMRVLLGVRSELRDLIDQLDALPDDDLSEFSQRASVQRAMAKHRQGDPSAPAAPSGDQGDAPDRGATKVFADLPPNLRPRRMVSVDGWEILVGKGASANDHLTTQIANGNDTFLHVEGVPGSHVIVRAQGDQTPPLETLLDAAQLAKYFSKMKDAGKASVNYAQRKHVKKPKGAKPGLVMLNQHKNLRVRKDEARLARLLGKQLGN